MSELLQVQNLSVEYRAEDCDATHALIDVSFSIERGEVLGLMGESGCGKTTLAMAILGLLPGERACIAGSVRFRGEDILTMPRKKLNQIRGAEISMVYQEPEIALSPFLRVGDQIAEVIRAHRKWKWNRCRDEAFAALERLGFEDPERIYGSYPHRLSGGQRQRIVFAQALACEPALIVADEPTASLDAQSQAEIIGVLREIKRQQRTSILLISHMPEIQASLADRLVAMSQGRIVEQGDFDQLYWNSSQPLTRAMLRSPASHDSHLTSRTRIALAELVR
jgi:peptide/nickel transport system ATP-binding protein